MPLASNSAVTFFSKRPRIWTAYQQTTSVDEPGEPSAVPLLGQLSCSGDIAPPTESHLPFSTESCSASSCRDNDLWLNGHVGYLLKTVVYPFWSRKGAIVQDRAQHLYARRDKILLSFAGGQLSSAVGLQHQHYSISSLPQQRGLRINSGGRRIDNDVIKLRGHPSDLRSELTKRFRRVRGRHFCVPGYQPKVVSHRPQDLRSMG